MQRLECMADLTERLRRAEEEARAYREAADMEASWAAGAVEYPQAWRQEESALAVDIASHLAGELWGHHQDCPSLLSRIREATGGRMIRPADDTRSDWRRYCPSHYMRMARADELVRVARRDVEGNQYITQEVGRRAGMAADEVAGMLGFDGDDELLQAIIREDEAGGALYTHAIASERAQELAAQDPELQGLRARHMEEYCATLAAVEAAEGRAEVYIAQADAQARLAEAIRQALAVMLAAPLPQLARQQKAGFVAALPTRAERRASAARTLGEAVRAEAVRLAGEARRIARETGEGAAIAGGWLADPARALAAEARASLLDLRREARGTFGLVGRHCRRPASTLAVAGGR